MAGWFRVPAFVVARLDGSHVATREEAIVDLLGRWDAGLAATDRVLRAAWRWDHRRVARLVAEMADWAAANNARCPAKKGDGQKQHQPRTSRAPAAHQPEAGTTPHNEEPRTSRAPAAHQPRTTPRARDPLSGVDETVDGRRTRPEGAREGQPVYSYAEPGPPPAPPATTPPPAPLASTAVQEHPAPRPPPRPPLPEVDPELVSVVGARGDLLVRLARPGTDSVLPILSLADLLCTSVESLRYRPGIGAARAEALRQLLADHGHELPRTDADAERARKEREYDEEMRRDDEERARRRADEDLARQRARQRDDDNVIPWRQSAR